MAVTTDTDRGRITAGGRSTTEKFYIYSSKAGKSPGESVQVLSRDTNTDKFVSSLKDQVIILEARPDPVGSFDSSDEWSKWLTKFNPTGELSLEVDDTAAIRSFEFNFTAPWDIKFRSSTDALNFSFGAPPVIGTDKAARLPVPGVDQEGLMLYCGLVPSQNTVLKSTVRDLFDYVGIAGIVPSLPYDLPSWSVSLDMSNASEKHNALWFNPSFGSQTTVRLQFRLDAEGILQELLNFALPGLKIQTADVICKKVLIAAEAETGPIGVDQGHVMFSVKCFVVPPDNHAVNMIAGIEFRKLDILLTFRLDSKDSLSGILHWLGGLISDELGFVKDLLNKDDLFEYFELRRMTIGLDTTEDAEKPKLSHFGIDIEVSATFGRGSDLKPVVFLVTYIWTEEGSRMGSIRGQFWNWFDLRNDPDLSPYFENWTDVQPITLTPASSIDLVSIIRGQKIENIPVNVPTQITRAQIFLSETTFAIGGTITAEISQGAVPQPFLGQLSLDASYNWGNSSAFKISFGIMAGIQPSTASKRNQRAVLAGQLEYDSSLKTWELNASLDGLYASTLYEFFDASSARHVMALIDSIAISILTVEYKYTAAEGGTGRSVGSSFKISGILLVAALQLDLTFEHKDDWTFTAELKPQDAQATLGEIIASILGDDPLNLPDFLANTHFDGQGGSTKPNTLKIDVHKGGTETRTSTGSGGAGMGPAAGIRTGATGTSFHFIAEVAIGDLALNFAQYHSGDWAVTVPSKRMVKVALMALPEVNVPLVGDITQPFDEMYYMWVQDATGQNKTKLPGLTRKDIQELNTSLSAQLVPNDKFKEPDDSDVLIGAGSHFAVIIKNPSGVRTCILSYNFMKPKDTLGSQALEGNSTKRERRITTAAAADTADTDANEDSGSSGQAPFKKMSGPLSISNIGLKYSEGKLRIMFDAIFKLGPLGFSLIGFSIDLGIITLDKIPEISASIQGLSASFEKPPFTIAGIIRHGNTGTLDYYSGGLIIGFVPYQFQAAGFYGQANPPGGQNFTSVFIFAKLEGPLVTLEFAEISGVTGGFGYKSDVRIPSADQIVTFPFIATKILDGSTDSALETLERLTSPEANGWFRPLDDTYWAAAGLKVDAFQMLSLDAVVVIQFGASIKIGLFGVAAADIPANIPSAKSSAKFAHIQLGIAVVVDFDYGTLKAEAQLSPNSYILHQDCHPTGGFGLYYWFDAPHADQTKVGNFVFTLGGYHQAFEIPEGYPNPPRLGISWSLGKNLSITGQAYFAITPKACMGGGRLHASFRAGPLSAWFDAFADFLINYKPFHFTAEVGVSVGVRLNIDMLFMHTHISVEIGADLYMWGPPFAGRVHVDFWVTSFDISFGDSKANVPAITLFEFYELVLQASSQQQNASRSIAAAAETRRITDASDPVTRPKNEGHVFLVQSGLMNNSEVPEREPNAPWTVRGGTFSFLVSCKMAINTAKRGDKTITYPQNGVYSRPMKLTNPMSSTLTIDITQKNVAQSEAEWGMDKHIKVVPTGLWAKYSTATDPTGGNNNISELLNSKDSGVPLMMGVLLTTPPPTMAPDKLPTYNIEDAQLQELRAEKNFPLPTQSHPEWEPSAPQEGPAQWKAVHDKWANPAWGTGLDGQAGFVGKWAEVFGWDKAMSQLAAIPKRLNERFEDLYVAAPMMNR